MTDKNNIERKRKKSAPSAAVELEAGARIFSAKLQRDPSFRHYRHDLRKIRQLVVTYRVTHRVGSREQRSHALGLINKKPRVACINPRIATVMLSFKRESKLLEKQSRHSTSRCHAGRGSRPVSPLVPSYARIPANSVDPIVQLMYEINKVERTPKETLFVAVNQTTLEPHPCTRVPIS
jgi:hypothetical protein